MQVRTVDNEIKGKFHSLHLIKNGEKNPISYGGSEKLPISFLETYKDFFNDEILDQKKYLRDFSKGNQKKVGLIATFLGSPNVIILDEPFANLDPTTQIRLKQLIKNQGIYLSNRK